MATPTPPRLESILGDDQFIAAARLQGEGPVGRLPINEEMLRSEPSGNLFGLTQNAGMGWHPADVGRPQYLILSTLGGLRDSDGRPIALGYHTGHWELDLLVRQAAETLKTQGALPFAAYCSDPCDGRSQGTTGMFDSLPYRNDAAMTLRRLIRSLPQRQGVLGVATCDKGLPAMMMALAGCADLPGVIVPGGVTLPTVDGEDAGKVQTIGARFAHNLIDLDYAATMGCRAGGSPGGGCQFLGTAATAQGVAESLGLATVADLARIEKLIDAVTPGKSTSKAAEKPVAKKAPASKKATAKKAAAKKTTATKKSEAKKAPTAKKTAAKKTAAKKASPNKS